MRGKSFLGIILAVIMIVTGNLGTLTVIQGAEFKDGSEVTEDTEETVDESKNIHESEGDTESVEKNSGEVFVDSETLNVEETFGDGAEDVLAEFEDENVEEPEVTDIWENLQGYNAEVSYGISGPRIVADSVLRSGMKVTYDCVWLGRYQRGNANNNNPLKWRVLAVNGTDAFLWCEDEVAEKNYHDSTDDFTWETCDLRKWLNGEFYENAFSEKEKKAIRTTGVINLENPLTGTYAGRDTVDKIYLLSVDEVLNPIYGFSKVYDIEDDARKRNGGECWWLRTPGTKSYLCGILMAGGEGLVYNGNGVIYRPGGIPYAPCSVYPVLHLDLSNKSAYTYAGTVCTDGTVNEKNKPNSGTVTDNSKYKITFDKRANDAELDFSSKIVLNGDKYGKLPKVKRNRYVFMGWYTKKNGGTKITSNTVVKLSKNQRLYAHWSVKTSIKTAAINVKACTYNGKRQEPAVVVKLGKKTLKENKDFTVKYSNNINAGNAAVVTITGKGAYRDSVSKKFKISPLSIAKKGYIKLTKDSYTWNGKETKPGVAVYAAITLPGSTVVTLQNKKDYTYKYKNNKEPGKASVIITGKGNYSGTKTIYYKINKKEQPATVNMKTLKKTYEDVKKSYAITVSEKKEFAKVTYTSSNKKVADVSNNKIVLKGCGKATISVKFSETKHYKAAEKKISVVVLKKQDIQTQIKDGTEVEYSVNPISLGAKAKGGLSYESLDTQIATVDQNGNLILKTAKKLGTVTIEIKAEETADYASAVKKIKVTTVQGTPVINCAPKTVHDVSEGEFNLGASCEVPLSYRSSDETIAQVDANGTVRFINASSKTVKIIISSQENGFYKSSEKEIELLIVFNPYPTTQDMDEDGFYEVPCTYFAWQQALSNANIALPQWGNAINWLNSAQNAGYETGNEPRANSIAVWSGVGGYGHVAYVTGGSGDTFIVNEGGRTDLDNTSSHGVVYGYEITNIVGQSRPYNPGQILLGFIYLP